MFCISTRFIIVTTIHCIHQNTWSQCLNTRVNSDWKSSNKEKLHTHTQETNSKAMKCKNSHSSHVFLENIPQSGTSQGQTFSCSTNGGTWFNKFDKNSFNWTESSKKIRNGSGCLQHFPHVPFLQRCAGLIAWLMRSLFTLEEQLDVSISINQCSNLLLECSQRKCSLAYCSLDTAVMEDAQHNLALDGGSRVGLTKILMFCQCRGRKVLECEVSNYTFHRRVVGRCGLTQWNESSELLWQHYRQILYQRPGSWTHTACDLRSHEV